MKLIPEIVKGNADFSQWRRDLHQYPELGFEEQRTAAFVAAQLESYGIKVTPGVGKTGVVGTLNVGTSNKSIGLRADMDALPMEEVNTFAHKSKHAGCMHGCGHDGHTVMLLAAARYLAQSQNFDGTVQFIFQPAEEANPVGSGAQAMIDDGLFERFPVDKVFALHNMPDLYAGAMATTPGPIMGSMDLFDVTLKGTGGHGAYPHANNDLLMVATQLLSAWQTIVSRNVDAQEGAVLSACSVNAGDSWNVMPDTAVIKGNIRTLSSATRDLIEQRFHQLTTQIAAAFDVEVQIDYRRCYPSCINDETQTAFACDVADTIFGADHVLRKTPFYMGSEDFAVMSRERPGCYMLLGTAPWPEGGDPNKGKNIHDTPADFYNEDVPQLHQADYDFNDEAIPLGATWFVRLAEAYLC